MAIGAQCPTMPYNGGFTAAQLAPVPVMHAAPQGQQYQQVFLTTMAPAVAGGQQMGSYVLLASPFVTAAPMPMTASVMAAPGTAIMPAAVPVPAMTSASALGQKGRQAITAAPHAHSRGSRGPASSSNEPLRVAGSTTVSGAAGAISKRLRQFSSVTVTAHSPDGVNTAAKALAMSSRFLGDEGRSISVIAVVERGPGAEISAPADPIWGDEVAVRFSVRIDSSVPVEADSPAVAVSIRVSAESMARRTAGAIAHIARERGASGTPIALFAMGTSSVNVSIAALGLARDMLVGDGIDLCFRPRFTTVGGADDQPIKPALQLDILIRSAGGQGREYATQSGPQGSPRHSPSPAAAAACGAGVAV